KRRLNILHDTKRKFLSTLSFSCKRRHMWLHAGFQNVFIKSLSYNQTIDGFMRMILLMDYAVYDITHYYQERLEGR
ncbi:MAG TPA: hypothetical protein PLA32_13565, partial [Smithella sp.]|nr:hypothetical protein [Smithella sp.]